MSLYEKKQCNLSHTCHKFKNCADFEKIYIKSDNGFAWISAHPLLEPLLNIHTASYMSVITYLNMLPYHVVFGLMIPCALSTEQKQFVDISVLGGI